MAGRAFAATVAAVTLALPMAPHAAAPTRMERAPAYVIAYCAKSRLLVRACPQALPRMAQPAPHWEADLCLRRHPGCRGLTADVLSLVDAGYGTKPPAWSHVVVEAGDLSTMFAFPFPTHGVRIVDVDGVFARARSSPIFLGAYTWSRHHGSVVLAPAFPAGGENGDHLIFRWQARGVGYAVSLHGWEPLSQALATLRRMVTSIRSG